MRHGKWCSRTALIAALAALSAGCGGGELSASALSKDADSVRSLASEGALLAEDAAAGKTTHTFTRVHASELEKAAAQTASTLETAETAPALHPKVHRLTTLARRVSDNLDQLGSASKSEQRALANELHRAAAQSNRISEGLK
jgi:hypothetical protein